LSWLNLIAEIIFAVVSKFYKISHEGKFPKIYR
jgi:hypothetical protein